MYRATFISLVCIFSPLSLYSAPVDTAAQQKPQASSASPWIVRTYRLYDAMDFETKTHGRLTAPNAPQASAGEKEVTEFLKRSNFVSKEFFTGANYPIPPGSFFVFDPKSATLVARTTESFHSVIASTAEDMHRGPRLLACSLHILEAEPAVIREELKLMAGSSDHSPSVQRLSALADQGKAKRIYSGNTETKSGQRVRLMSTTRRPFASGFTLDEKGNYDMNVEHYESGTTLELDPVLGEDGRTINTNFALSHDFSSPTERWARASAGIANQAVESQVTDLHNVLLTSAITLLSGQSRLLGVWRPEIPGNPDPKADVLQAAFLRMDSVLVGPLQNPQLLLWLTTFGEKISPTPKTAPPEPDGIPKGMTTRLFRMEPEMLGMLPSTAADAAPFGADPFAAAGGVAPQSAPTEQRFTTQATALEILRSMGAVFPAGSSATYDAKRGLLLVRNTPANMEFLNQLTSETRRSQHRTLALTAHIIQAEGAVIRKLMEDSRGISDHSQLWQSVEELAGKQQAVIIRSALIGAQSGYRGKVEYGAEFAESSASLRSEHQNTASSPTVESKPTDPGTKQTEQEKQPQPQGSSAVANAAIKTAAAPAIEGSHETIRVGTSLEIDPVIGEDNRTIDLNLALKYDFAKPTHRAAAEPAADKTRRLEVAGHDLHRIDVANTTTMETGTWRLLHVWKPQGSAEFDGKDVLQALFVRSDVVPVSSEVEASQP